MSSPAVESVRNVPLIVEHNDYVYDPMEEDGGFPFERDTEKDRENPFRSQLDDLAKRHPEFAGHLNFGETFPFRSNLRDRLRRDSEASPGSSPSRSARQDPFQEYRHFTDRRPFGSRFERFPFGRSFDEPDFRHEEQLPKEKPQEPPQQTEDEKEEKGSNLAQSNTTDLGQKQEPDAARNQRSMSAPPDNRNSQQRFVSSCTIPVNRENSDGNEAMGPKQSQQTPNTPKAETHQNRSNERVIPIHVEGRDEPIIPKNVHPTFNAQTQKPSNPQSPPVFGQKPTQFQHFKGDVPSQTNVKVEPEKVVPSSQPQTPPPPPPPTPSASQIDKIQMIQKDVLDLMNQVEKFGGKYRDKQYLYLDEMLTRNLIKLDNIETEGKDNIRQARREAIKCIEKCISILETKAKQESAAAEKMETENALAVEQTTLEVSGVSRSGTEANVAEEEQKMEVQNVSAAPIAEAEVVNESKEITSQVTVEDEVEKSEKKKAKKKDKSKH